MSEKERVSLAIEPELLARFDAHLSRSGTNRSEAVRDLIRGRLLEEDWASPEEPAVGSLMLVYDHTKRDLADRLIEAGHAHHGLVVATMHVHLDHDHCMEVIAMRGPRRALRDLADGLIGMKGVLHGELVLTRAEV